jgi:hypothetical protein
MSTTSKQRKRNRRNRKSQARDASKNQPKEATQGKKSANRPTLFPLSAERILGYFNEYAEALEAGQLYRARRIFSVALGVRAADRAGRYKTATSWAPACVDWSRAMQAVQAGGEWELVQLTMPVSGDPSSNPFGAPYNNGIGFAPSAIFRRSFHGRSVAMRIYVYRDKDAHEMGHEDCLEIVINESLADEMMIGNSIDELQSYLQNGVYGVTQETLELMPVAA